MKHKIGWPFISENFHFLGTHYCLFKTSNLPLSLTFSLSLHGNLISCSHLELLWCWKTNLLLYVDIQPRDRYIASFVASFIRACMPMPIGSEPLGHWKATCCCTSTLNQGIYIASFTNLWASKSLSVVFDWLTPDGLRGSWIIIVS